MVGSSCFGRQPDFLDVRLVDEEGRDARRRRARRTAGALHGRRPAPPLLLRLPEGRGRDGRGLGRRLVPHRRPGAARRRRQLLLRRPQEERDPPQRREHLGRRGGERAEPAPGGEGLGRRRHARRGARRRGAGLHRPARARRRRARRRRWPPASRSMRWRSWPTTRRRATSPSSTRCRSRRRRRSSAAQLRELAQSLPGQPHVHRHARA